MKAIRVHRHGGPDVLIIGQEGGTHREGGGPEKVPDFEISDPKLCAYDKATGKLVGEVALPRNADANDLHAERQTIHRRSYWGLQSAGGTYRVLTTMTLLDCMLG